jgi:hypothetical protein
MVSGSSRSQKSSRTWTLGGAGSIIIPDGLDHAPKLILAARGAVPVGILAISIAAPSPPWSWFEAYGL